METKNLNWEQARKALNDGLKIKLPEWSGYWFIEDGKVKVMTGAGEVLETPYTEDYKNRTDWSITDGSRCFGGALKALKNGKLVARKGWNGKGMFIFLRPADTLSSDFIIDKVKSLPKSLKTYYVKQFAHHSKEDEKGKGPKSVEVDFLPYICMKAADGSIVNGWLASQTDMLSEDWFVLD